MRKGLLSGTAVAGLLAVPAAVPALAGTPEVGDSFTVTLSGNLRFSVLAFEQDLRAGRGRGYRFSSDESEVKFAAGGVADNGLEYGMELELQTQTNDTGNADETWAYLRGNWGEINVGDQDDAADRMAIGGEDAMPGRGGYDGAVGDVFNLPAGSFAGPSPTFTGDATKVTYFTPRVFGFQAGASWTPDSSHNGGAAINDADGSLFNGSLATLIASAGLARDEYAAVGVSYENTASFGLNYAEDFNGFGVVVAGTVAWADETEALEASGEPATVGPAGTAGSFGDAWRWQVGAKLAYAGFELGGAWGGGHNTHAAGYVSNTGNLVASDPGQWADIGLNYSTGPYKVGAGAFWAWAETNAFGFSGPDTEVQIYSVGGNYKVAPGLEIATDVNFIAVDNINGAIPAVGGVPVDNDGTVLVVSTIFSF